MACYLHSTYNVASVKKSQREKMIFWQTFCTRRQILPARAKWTNSLAIFAFRIRSDLSAPFALLGRETLERQLLRQKRAFCLEFGRPEALSLLQRAPLLPAAL